MLLGVTVTFSGLEWGQESLGNQSRGQGSDTIGAGPLATAPEAARSR